MSEGDGDQKDKPYEASRRKLEDARRKGEIVRSQDVVSLIALMTFILGVVLLFDVHISKSLNEMTYFLQFSQNEELQSSTYILQRIFNFVIPVIGFLFIFPSAIIILGLLGAKQILFTPDKLMPKMNRVSLISNARKKFGLSGLFEFLKTLLKFVCFSVVLVYFWINSFGFFQAAILCSEFSAILNIYSAGLHWLWLTLGLFLVFAVVDALWQFHEHARKNRMSHKEMRDEHKNEEGDETVRQQRRARAEEIATNRMLLDVPKATVVITNPTHYAVALQWDGQSNTVPKCVAKGTDETARRIRELAIQSGVPLHRDPRTARDLYANVKIGVSIDSAHFKAVAVAIGYARRMQKRMKHDV
jgi:flagellar biosynthetic protein FlhB